MTNLESNTQMTCLEKAGHAAADAYWENTRLTGEDMWRAVALAVLSSVEVNEEMCLAGEEAWDASTGGVEVIFKAMLAVLVKET